MSKSVRRWDLDQDTYATDNGPPCPNCKTCPGMYIYQVTKRQGSASHDPRPTLTHLTAQCASCHYLMFFVIQDSWPDIFEVKRAHEAKLKETK